MIRFIKQFSNAQRSLIKVIDQFPKDQRKKKLFGEWNLKDLPGALWNTRIWNDKETTPKEFIQLEINHYENTHGRQIKQVLAKTSYKLKF